MYRRHSHHPELQALTDQTLRFLLGKRGRTISSAEERVILGRTTVLLLLLLKAVIVGWGEGLHE